MRSARSARRRPSHEPPRRPRLRPAAPRPPRPGAAPVRCRLLPRPQSGRGQSGLDPFPALRMVRRAEDRNPNADFDTAFYRRQSGPTRLDPVRPLPARGAARGLDPSPAFSTALYLARYPDVVAAGVNPLVHFRNDGRTEPRGRALADRAGPPSRAGRRAETTSYAARFRGRTLSLTLERPQRPDPAADFAPRVCLQLCVDGLEYDALLDALRAFEAGRQDSLALTFDTEPARHPPMPTQLLAFERCFLTLPATAGAGTCPTPNCGCGTSA